MVGPDILVQLSGTVVRMLVALVGGHKSGLTACLGVSEEIIMILRKEIRCVGMCVI